MRFASTTIMAAAVALALSACGDDTAGGPAEGPTVTVQDIAFQEQSVSVEAGTTVTWANQDSVAHTVTSGTPDETTGVFDEELPAGEQANVAVDEPGTYAYWCKIHPNMTAELVVEPAEE